MKQLIKRTILLGAAALCWGIMFPEYTFTPDSYTVFVQEAEEAEESEETEGTEEAGSAQELYRAIQNGKVRYRFQFYEYLKNHLFSMTEDGSEGDAFLRRGLCMMRRDAGI
ncbi:MAG: hypothetical protein HDR21_10440 [Lachnospiraceae bacterium]|nr:hypothetical protein [Lachnospiraceae bacterium]